MATIRLCPRCNASHDVVKPCDLDAQRKVLAAALEVSTTMRAAGDAADDTRIARWRAKGRP
jgi:hypothetical protein